MLKITKQELNDLIDIEVYGDGLYPDAKYDNELQKALSGAIDYSYIDCIKTTFPKLSHEDLLQVQNAVIEGIKERLGGI